MQVVGEEASDQPRAAGRSVSDHAGTPAAKIRRLIAANGSTIRREVERKELYFRVSVIGACNLSCPFCHNEGGAQRGLLSLDVYKHMAEYAQLFGFERVQFTGGEPLIRPDIADFVATSRGLFQSIGITTNGTFLQKRLTGLLEAGITQIHISLQSEELVQTDPIRLCLPDWLAPSMESLNAHGVRIKLNMPLDARYQAEAEVLLLSEECKDITVQLFTILPKGLDGAVGNDGEAFEIAGRVNSERAARGDTGRVLVRPYRPPAGLRCATCAQYEQCKEQSRSLRLGADGTLRPCLATRQWDVPLREHSGQSSFEEATLLALDYDWSHFVAGS